ncbi:DUF1553 domain-containing protein [Planctomycetes bacterium K23_9]|uniref:Planctomycete cytochrome C n=1 Tax=Stieleria marina TaxID=1930275 RepID=A0A517NM88_9BACT|nr:Planctomycete cytochrome C [Planctomycetes bacterium K23_9]
MSITRRLFVVLAALLFVNGAPADESAVDFNRDIRPILSENCYHCHGPDESSRAADLRLDTEEGAKEYAVVAGDADSSELMDRVLTDDEDVLMPPPDSERSLTKEQTELLRRWIDEGAAYQKHWSFNPLSQPKVPEIAKGQVAHNAIDYFILKKLNQQQLQPTPPADRETLIRRATFDLTGLPPTIAEIDAFLADQSPDAYSRLIDGLLKRDSYGERMASVWLDAARYSDTYGYQQDRDRFVWPWRDWVIQSLNDNMPYDQFITEQLAGDLLPGATRDQVLATTFNRLHPQKVEGGSVPEEFRIEYVADRAQTVATALMGLTYECCRCHNHKYDPLSQKEYYQLTAFFDNIDEAGLYSYFTPEAIPTPGLPLPTADQEKQLKKLQAVVDKLAVSSRSAASAKTPDLRDIPAANRFAKPIASLDFEGKPSGRNKAVQGVSGRGVKLTGDDPVPTEVGNFHRYEPFSVSLWMKTPDHKERAVVFHRSRAWTDAASRGYQLLIEDGRLSWSLIHFWPGNAIRVRTIDPIAVGSWVHVSVTNDGSSKADGVGIYVNGQRAKTEIVRDHLTRQITGGGGDTIAIGERFRDNGFKHGLVDQFRVFDIELTPLEALRLSKSGENYEAVSTNAASTKAVQQHLLLRHDVAEIQRRARLQAARTALCEVQDKTQEIMVMRELDQRKQTFVLDRGAYDAPSEPVGPGTPAALTPFPEDAPSNRLGLAQWLTSPDHPLTSRVAVNRLWQLCFGTGLVRTPEDFGSQGQPPTHPELLDYLAIDFREDGWDIKHAVKQIMMSATYRQSSETSDLNLSKKDPTNQWLARFPTYRLSAEMLRDNCLAVSGRLVSKVGGPPVKPYEVEASFKPSPRDKGEGLYRRSVYTYWKRTGPAPMMMALDAAKRDVCRVQRERTSSPLQAFVLLNGPQFVESARGLAEQLIDQHSQDDEKIIAEAFRRLTSRRANKKELKVLGDLLNSQQAYFDKDEQRAKAFLAVGDAEPDAKSEPNRLAAITVVVGTLMNYDESVMKR